MTRVRREDAAVRAVITEGELKRLADTSRITVPRGAIVTPAARDYAGEHGIALVETAETDVAGAGIAPRVAGSSLGEEARGQVRAGYLEAGHIEVGMQVEELMLMIARAAVAKLRPCPAPEVLVRVIATVLARLGYAVGVSGVTQG